MCIGSASRYARTCGRSVARASSGSAAMISTSLGARVSRKRLLTYTSVITPRHAMPNTNRQGAGGRRQQPVQPEQAEQQQQRR